MDFRLLNRGKNVALETAQAVAGYAATGKQTFQNQAGIILGRIHGVLNDAKLDGQDAANAIKGIMNDVGDMSLGGMADNAKQTAQKVANYI